MQMEGVLVGIFEISALHSISPKKSQQQEHLWPQQVEVEARREQLLVDYQPGILCDVTAE